VKRLLLFLAACHAELEPPWQLDHDRVVAVRATPPGIVTGETALLDALVSHAGAPTDVEAPTGATATHAPGRLFEIVHFVFDHWEIQAPDDAMLADARTALGLAPDAPVPLEITLDFRGGLVATKVVWLGEARANPVLPAVTIDGAAPGASIEVGAGATVTLSAAADDVRWLTSVGELEDADAPVAYLHAGGAQEGEFVVVVRDGDGGIVWQVWPIMAR
jgi:hypothetical protein